MPIDFNLLRFRLLVFLFSGASGAVFVFLQDTRDFFCQFRHAPLLNKYSMSLYNCHLLGPCWYSSQLDFKFWFCALTLYTTCSVAFLFIFGHNMFWESVQQDSHFMRLLYALIVYRFAGDFLVGFWIGSDVSFLRSGLEDIQETVYWMCKRKKKALIFLHQESL